MKEPQSVATELPAVTVVLCTYNGEKYIDQQLHSIRNQTYKNLLILISDDASSDRTWERLKIHAAADPRIQLHQNLKNQGYNQNFSQSCERVTTPLLAFADQDDLWHEEKIERLVRALEKTHPWSIAIHAHLRVIALRPQLQNHFISDLKETIFFASVYLTP